MNARRLRLFLKRGGLIAYPTESCYGLGCDPRNQAAVRAVLRLKGRSPAKGLILIAAHERQLHPYIAPLSPALRQRMRAKWPGPHTWLVPASQRCPSWLTGGRATVAVRVTAHAGAAALCRLAGMALVSTSANRSGAKSARDAATCHHLFGRRAMVFDGPLGARRRPSTIQDLVSGNIIRR